MTTKYFNPDGSPTILNWQIYEYQNAKIRHSYKYDYGNNYTSNQTENKCCDFIFVVMIILFLGWLLPIITKPQIV